jgi:hypothetical protein
MEPDPAAMRAAARQLVSGADRLRGSAAAVSGHVDAMAYAGPAADRFRAATGDRVAVLRLAAERLEAGLSSLLRAADEVELQQSQRTV